MLLLYTCQAIGAILAVNEYIQCYSVMHHYTCIYLVYDDIVFKLDLYIKYMVCILLYICIFIYYIYICIVYSSFSSPSVPMQYICKSNEALDGRRYCRWVLFVYL